MNKKLVFIYRIFTSKLFLEQLVESSVDDLKIIFKEAYEWFILNDDPMLELDKNVKFVYIKSKLKEA